MNFTHIVSKLLQEYDCVILPEIGGFIANKETADIDVHSGWFSPPRREIVFNSNLNTNDGLLAKFIAEEQECSYADALNIVFEDCREIKEQLEGREGVFFENVGELKYDNNENLVFSPLPTNNLAIDNFGLPSFHFNKIEEISNSNYKSILPSNATVSKQYHIVRAKVNTKKIYGAAAIFIIGLGVSTSLFNKISTKHSNVEYHTIEASLLPKDDSMGEELTTVSSTHKIEPLIENEPCVEKENHSTDIIPKKEIVAKVPVKVQHYIIIAGSFSSKSNAHELQNEIKNMGFSSDIIEKGDQMYRVTYGSYDSKNEALEVLGQINRKKPKSGAWLTKYTEVVMR